MTFRAYYTIDGKKLEREIQADCTHDVLVNLPQQIIEHLDDLFIVHNDGRLERP